jgi:DNA modification methylase
MGSGTTAGVALAHDRQYLGCELNPDYGNLQQDRIQHVVNYIKTRDKNKPIEPQKSENNLDNLFE